MRNRLILLFFPFLAAYLIFLLLPIVRILTFNSFGFLIKDAHSGILSSIYYTYLIALAVAVISVMLALPYSFVMARRTSVPYRIADSLVEIPIMIPSTVVGIMILLTFAPQMPVGSLIVRFFPGYTFTDSLFAVIITLLFVSSAYSIRVVGVSYRQEILRYEEEAMTLGISDARSFLLLSIPMLIKPMARGIVLSWARSISAVGSLLIVAYYIFPSFTQLAGVFIYSQFLGGGLPDAAASSGILILTGIAALVILRAMGGKNAAVY
ncbi:MAG: ABC transporter permease [Candidatus Thermoplasmatota archaeon]|nr:ABC transporter permease [Candidatus Thermoplasmatota archaeon]